MSAARIRIHPVPRGDALQSGNRGPPDYAMFLAPCICGALPRLRDDLFPREQNRMSTRGDETMLLLSVWRRETMGSPTQNATFKFQKAYRFADQAGGFYQVNAKAAVLKWATGICRLPSGNWPKGSNI
jgi:hypothetical protein